MQQRRSPNQAIESHPQHALAKSQMAAFGGIVTVVLKRDLAGTPKDREKLGSGFRVHLPPIRFRRRLARAWPYRVLQGRFIAFRFRGRG